MCVVCLTTYGLYPEPTGAQQNGTGDLAGQDPGEGLLHTVSKNWPTAASHREVEEKSSSGMLSLN